MNSERKDDYELIFPLTEIEEVFESLSNKKNNEFKAKKEFVTIRERRRSLLNGPSILPLLRMDSGIDLSNSSDLSNCSQSRWKTAIKKMSKLQDPWSDFNMHSLIVESAKRHRYNAHDKTWLIDDILVKMEKEPFNRGAMRNCFRLKRITIQSSDHGISKDTARFSRNYVAKQYLEQVDKDVYFKDVHLQMDAKVWGQEFNKYDPPKKVDILQMAILEFPDRPGEPLYHLEHYIDGKYIKYNSNSGFVNDSSRFTPQAFSHFTFERSSHNLIVVDIQGVGDLWTDPQIHTVDGLEYGEGNLGTRGMALFFYSHRCNSICHKLKLSNFDLAPTEYSHSPKMEYSSKTDVRGNKQFAVLGVSPQQYHAMMAWSHNDASLKKIISSTPQSPDKLETRMRYKSECSYNSKDIEQFSPTIESFSDDSTYLMNGYRLTSESDSSETITETDREKFHEIAIRSSRPSCVDLDFSSQMAQSPLSFNRKESALFFNDSVLGKIHHDLAYYHNCGRFLLSNDQDVQNIEGKKASLIQDLNEELDNVSKGCIDSEAALFHETIAAELGNKLAIVTLAHLYLGLSTDVLSNIKQPKVDEILGETFMLQAAIARDRRAMIFVSRAYVKGTQKFQKNYKDAEFWYKLVLNETDVDDSEEFDSAEPQYILKAELANLYFVGSEDLPQDFSLAGDYYTEAGDDATNMMKGKMANKFYQLAENAYAQVPS